MPQKLPSDPAKHKNGFSLPKENRNVLAVPATDEKVARKQVATVHLLPQVGAARLVLAYNPNSSLDLAEIAAKIAEHAKDAHSGDLLHAEAMLLAQAHALQAMFVNLAERAKQQTGLAQVQTLTGLALKTQNQCRATLQTLVDVKYPRQATFIRQANIAGQQQVNNGTFETDGTACSRDEKSISSNELLEAQHGKRVDSGAAQAPIGNDKGLATLGKINGTKDGRRQTTR